MFTGIIQGLGRLTEIRHLGREIRLTVEPDFDWDGPLVLGESIAVSGACLTVVEHGTRWFSAHVSDETISRTSLKGAGPGERVNLERALRLSDRLGGHLVTGHIDALGVIREKRARDMSLVFTIGLDRSLIPYVIEKGSIAVDGISLTVNQVTNDSFMVNVIPHTAEMTTLAFKKAGDYVNVETDLIGKYVAGLLGKNRTESKIDLDFLAKHGFV